MNSYLVQKLNQRLKFWEIKLAVFRVIIWHSPGSVYRSLVRHKLVFPVVLVITDAPMTVLWGWHPPACAVAARCVAIGQGHEKSHREMLKEGADTGVSLCQCCPCLLTQSLLNMGLSLQRSGNFLCKIPFCCSSMGNGFPERWIRPIR